MSDSKSTSLKSTGKLRTVSRNNDGLRCVQFVPDADHTVHQRRKTLAVFVETHKGAGAAWTIPYNGTPIKLSIPAKAHAVFVQTITKAAVSQCDVDVKVDFSDSNKPKLVALTVPATTHRK